MKKIKQQKGITLIALVITIIILLILAGISIQALTNTGLFAQAENAKKASEIANIKEQIQLDIYQQQLEPPLGTITEEQLETILRKYGTIIYEEDEVTIKGITTTDKGYEILLSEIYSGTTTEGTSDPSLPTNPATTIEEAQSDYMLTKTVNSPIEDEFGNEITVPAGFKIKSDDTTNNATTVNAGIVIVDSNENEFVWIPTGKIYTDTEKTEVNAKTIGLNRYTFSSTGAETPQNDAAITVGDYTYQELATSTYGNTTAKAIETFKTSATTNKGFYIGRYEARTATARSASGDSLTTITEKGTDYVYNYVTQIQAADLARNMYTSDKYISDLMNSYAWDTATLFLQTFGTNSTYSMQNSINTGSLATTGTNDTTKYTGTQDVQCNVYDMASNVREWTTETYSSSSLPCVYRGGNYNNSGYYSSNRYSLSTSFSHNFLSFRPLLYL